MTKWEAISNKSTYRAEERGYYVWAYADQFGDAVYQVTKGEMPTSDGGYYDLHSLLSAKGLA